MWLPLYHFQGKFRNSLKTTLISCVIRFWNFAEHQALAWQSIPISRVGSPAFHGMYVKQKCFTGGMQR